jgi:hypothetical protein
MHNRSVLSLCSGCIVGIQRRRLELQDDLQCGLRNRIRVGSAAAEGRPLFCGGFCLGAPLLHPLHQLWMASPFDSLFFRLFVQLGVDVVAVFTFVFCRFHD